MYFQKTKRRQWSWTRNRLDQAHQIKTVVNELEEYWPLTLRQIYYQLVNPGLIANTRSRYNDLSKVIKQMRLDEYLPWGVLEDRHRRVTDKRGFTDHHQFIDQELEGFLDGYGRCYVQTQENYVELWFEKDALSTIFERVAWPYCIRAVVCKGYQSVTFLDSFRDRAEAAMQRDQTPVILYFGDLDPSGVQMFEATVQTLEDEMDLDGEIEFRRVALEPYQVEVYDLPRNPDAVKESDTRTKKYRQRYGDLAVELDALHPKTLREMAINAIEQHFDMEVFQEQKQIEAMDQVKINSLKERIMVEVQKFMTSHT